MSTEGDNTSSEGETDVFEYGDVSLSDVIFVVDGQEFHCHKMVLAAKSEYFKAMLFSDFKEKEEKRITIDANPTAFSLLLNIIYDGFIAYPEIVILCSSFETLGIPSDKFNKQFWDGANDLFALADRFLLYEFVRESFELMLIRYDRDCPYDKKGCYHCAVKLLLALCHGMEGYKKISVSSKTAVKDVLGRMSGDIQMPVKAMRFLLGRK